MMNIKYVKPISILNNRIPHVNSIEWDDATYIFIHIPKTGGTSIFSEIKRLNLNIKHYWHLFPGYIPLRVHYKFVTIVRNPYDRAVSAFFHYKNGGINEKEYNFKIYMERFDTFEEWVLYGLNLDIVTFKYNIHNFICFMKQAEWLLYNGEKIIKNVLRYENIEEEVKKIGIFNIPHNNVGKHNEWREYYKNEEVRKKVYYLYKEDFELLDYPEEIY
jgi:hypothetical protein